MRKRIILIALFLFLLPSLMFADILQLGLNFGYDMRLKEIQEQGIDYNPNRFSLAPELRLNIWHFQLDTVGAMSFGNRYFRFDSQTTFALQFDISNIIRIGAGVGVSIPFENFSGEWYVNGDQPANFLETLKDSNLLYKVNIGIPISIVEITANWIMPAGCTFRENNNYWPQIGESTFSLGVLFNLF